MPGEDDLRIEDLNIDDHGPNGRLHDEDYDPSASTTSRMARSTMLDPETRDEMYRAELHGLHEVNTVVENVIASLAKVQENVQKVGATVDNAKRLLHLWERILSQAEHTQRLLQSEQWEGATKDLAGVEAEAAERQREAEKRAEEARERAAAREREATAAEARRAAAEKKPGRGIRKGATGSTRGSSGTTGSRGGASSSSTRGNPATRTTRGVGKGFGSVRGRGRGTGAGTS